MAAGSSVDLLFRLLGDPSGAQDAFDVTGDAADKAGKKVEGIGNSSDNAVHRIAANFGEQLPGKFGQAQEAFDVMDTRAMGFRDTITGVQDSMTGFQMLLGDRKPDQSFADGLLTLGMGVGDLASGFANFLVPMMAVGSSLTAAAAAAEMSVVSFVAHKVATVAGTVATGAATAAQWLWNAALSANPIGLVIVAVAALVTGIVLFFTKTETGRKIFDVAMNGIKVAFGWVSDAASKVYNWARDAWPAIKGFFTGPVTDAVKWIVDKWNTVITFFREAPGKIRSAASGMWDGIKDAFRSAINWLIGKWNSLRFSVPSIDLGPAGSFGGFTIGVPAIPYLAAGGIVTGPTLAVLGDNASRREAVVPLERAGELGFGGGATVEINVNAGVIPDPVGVVRALEQALTAARRAGYPVRIQMAS
jgi:hypothetical protein